MQANRSPRGYCAVSALLTVAALSSAGCWSPVELPAPADPTREVPYVAEKLGPAPPGRQWLVLDTPGESARVSTVRGNVTGVTSGGHEVTGEATKDLCATPCVVDLHAGAHTLLFASELDPTRQDRLEVHLQGDPLVVRHVIEQTSLSPNGAIGMEVWGLLGMATGTVMTPLGVSHGSSGVEEAGVASLAAGALLFGGGLLYAYLGRGTHAPSATTQWTLPRAGAPVVSTAGASRGPALFRF